MPFGISCQDKNFPIRHKRPERDDPELPRKTVQLGQILKRLRGTMKQGEFAKRLGIAQSTLSRYEHNQRQPDIDFLMRIVEQCNVPLDQLLYERDEEEGVSLVGEGERGYEPVSDSDWVIEELIRSPAIVTSVKCLLEQKHGRQLLRAIGDLNDRQITVILGVVKTFQAK
jgi:transcriptional regulator with XRE-family HTH domain